MLINIIWGIIGLGIIILVHEFGHFLLAKLTKIKVEVFSLGFGPALLRKKIGETYFQIAVIPIGGYVKLYGESVMEPEENDLEDERAFYNRPAWARFLTVFAGPLFNFIFASILISGLLVKGIPSKVHEPVLFVPADSSAYKSGLRTGDLVLEVKGERIKYFEDIVPLILMSPGEKIPLVVLRGNSNVNLELFVPVNKEETSGKLEVESLLPPVVEEVFDGTPAKNAGLKKGDVFIKVNGKNVIAFQDIAWAVKNSGGQKLTFLVKRGNSFIKFKLKPAKVNERWIIGVKAKDNYKVVVKSQSNVFRALWQGFGESAKQIKKVWDGLLVLLSGKISVRKSLAGPIRMVAWVSESIPYLGVIGFLSFIAFLSNAIGFFNLFPLPGLDGSYILVNMFEMIFRVKLSRKLIIGLEVVGTVVLVSLMVFVVFNDIWNLVAG